MKQFTKYICTVVVLLGMSVSAWGTKTYTYDLKTAAGSAAGSNVTYWYSESGCTTHCKTINSGSNKISTGSAATIYYKDASIASTAFTVCSAGDGNYVGFASYSSECYLFIGKSGAYITLPTYSGEKITNVTVTRGNGGGGSTTANIYSGTTAASTELTLGTSGNDYSFDIKSAHQTSSLKFQVTSAANTSINKIVITTEPSSFTVTYYDNGKDGGGAAPTDASSPYDPNSTVTVLGNVNSMTRSGYTFNGWNTKADGSGTNFAVGATFTITKDTTFYAKWAVNSHTLAVASVDYIVISATTPSVAEGSSTIVNYGTTVTLSHGDPDGGRQWSGWKVYKTSDASTTVSVDGNNQFTMPDYNVTVSANLYGDFRFSCSELTLTTKLVTASTPIFITSAASQTVRSQDSILISGSGLTPNTALTFPDLNSKFSVKSRANGALSTKADGTIDTVAYIFYTPDAGDTSDGLDKLAGLTVAVGGVKPKQVTLSQEIIGRHLPADFVIAAKYKNVWYALPDSMTGTRTPDPIEIAVDDNDNPSVAYTSTNTFYKLYGQDTVFVKLGMTNNGTANSPLFGSSSSALGKSGSAIITNKLGAGYLWKLEQKSTSITNPQDAKYIVYSVNNTSNHLRLKNKPNQWGFYSSGEDTIRLIPASTTPFTEAEVVAWGQKNLIVEVDKQTIGATQVRAKLNGSYSAAKSLSTTTGTSVKGTSTRYNYTLDFTDEFDFSNEANKEKILLFEWLDGSGDVKYVSSVAVPLIIASSINMSGVKTGAGGSGTKGYWKNLEVHVLPGATLTANTGSFSNAVTINELHIYPGATVQITPATNAGTLTVNTLILRNGWNRLTGEKSYDVARLFIQPYIDDDHKAATLAIGDGGEVYMDWYIDYDQYYPVAVPWEVTTSEMTYLNTSGAASAGVMMRYYDGASRAANVQEGVGSGANWKDDFGNGGIKYPATLTPGQGYIMTARRPAGKAFSIVRMPLTIPSAAWTTSGEQGSVEDTHKDQVSVTAHGTASTPSYAQGWNLIANPYMSLHQGELNYTDEGEIEYANIPNTDFTEYDQVAIETTKLKPSSAFLVQAPKTGTVTFGTANRKASAPSYRKEAQQTATKQKAYISLNNEETSDMMGLLISEEYTNEYEINADLQKLLGDGTSLRTYMHFEDLEMAYLAINETSAKEWIPVSVRIPADGEYTYSLHTASRIDELEGIYLQDYYTGRIINLIEENYTFSAEAGTINNRFALNAAKGPRETPTDIDILNATGETDRSKPIKFIYRDKVYILYGNDLYDATGKRVKTINK